MTGNTAWRMCLIVAVQTLITLASNSYVGAEDFRETGLEVEFSERWERVDQASVRDRAGEAGDASRVLGTWSLKIGPTSDADLRLVIARGSEQQDFHRNGIEESLSALPRVSKVDLESASELRVDGVDTECANARLEVEGREIRAKILTSSDQPWIFVITTLGEWDETKTREVDALLSGVKFTETASFDELAAHWIWGLLFAGMLGISRFPKRRQS